MIGVIALICVTCLSKNPLTKDNASTNPQVLAVRSATTAQRVNEATVPMIPEQNSGQPVVLALDHFVITDKEGKNQQVAISPIATKETLMARIKALSGKSVSYPVIYPVDRNHTVSNRKLLTSEITIQLPDSKSATQVAYETGLTLVSQPDYAPGFAIFKAEDPLAAWSISEKLLAVNSYPVVEQIVASQKSKRALPNDPLFADQWHLNIKISSMLFQTVISTSKTLGSSAPVVVSKEMACASASWMMDWKLGTQISWEILIRKMTKIGMAMTQIRTLASSITMEHHALEMPPLAAIMA
jgi:hypothetical protein